jgi:mRNA interferase MazF
VICERFETIVVPFPFSDIKIVKRRPALVISGSNFNRMNQATIVAMITTAKTSTWPSDVMIGDLLLANLKVPCVVRWKLATIPNNLIQKKLGFIAPFDRLACERQLANILL